MKPCDRFQPQLLDHLYGALEAGESQALADHLGGCSACQTELVRAEEQMALIAAAAKAEFPWVRFEVPKETLATEAAEVASRGGWLRWGVAAAVIFALAGIGIPSVWFWQQQEGLVQAETTYQEAEAELAELDARQQRIVQSAQSIKRDVQEKANAANKTLASLHEEANQLAKTFQEQRGQTFAELNAKQMNLSVVGPKSLEAGALNQFQVQTKDLRQRPVQARVSFSIADQDNRVVYKEENVVSQGNLDVLLPRDLPLKPNLQLNLMVTAQKEQGQQPLKETVSLTEPLYLTHLATDKPVYRPGDTVRFRSLTLERFSLRPAAEDLQLVYSLLKPTGERIEILRGSSQLMNEQDKTTILGPNRQPVRGVGAGEYRISADGPDGEYQLTVSESNGRFPPQDRKFFVSSYQKSELNNEPKSSTKTQEANDKKLIVEFFPEGGDLVADLTNRVYFQVRTAGDKPAELEGRIVDDANQPVAEVSTWSDPDHPESNQGMGVFAFTPQAGKKYQLKIDGPAGIEGPYFLPEVKTEGVVLSIAKGVIGDREPIQVVIQNAGTDRSFLVGAYCRGRLMAQQTVDLKKGEVREIKLGPESGVGGVYRVTVFEREAGNSSRLIPRAERLIYRVPAERLKLAFKPEKASYAPGEKVKLQMDARDENNQPLPAIMMVAVVDQRVLKRVGEKTYRSMPAQFLLTTEIRRPEDLEDADFLLGPGPAAAKVLDLLLGTQGWRRFAEQDPTKFRKEHKTEAERFLALNGQISSRLVDFSQQEMQRMIKEFEKKALHLEQRLAKADEDQTLFQKGEQQKKELDRLKNEAEIAQIDRQAAVLIFDDAKRNLTAAGAKLNDGKDFLRNRALPALMVFALVVGIAGLAMGLVRNKTPQAVRYFATAACSLLVFGFLAMTELALSGGSSTPFGNQPQVVLNQEDWGALFSLDNKLAKKDNAIAVKPKPAAGSKIMSISRIRPKGKGPIRLPHDVVIPKANDQMEKQPAGPDQTGQEVVPAQSRSFAGIPLPPSPPPPLVVREYAHVRTPAGAKGKGDFTETLFWQPVLVLPDGKGEISFELSDSVTTFQVRAVAHTLDGRLAETTTELISRKP